MCGIDGVSSSVEDQRDHAQASAWKAKDLARKLNEQRLVVMAREEGRKLGYSEGLSRGRDFGVEYVRGPALENGGNRDSRHFAERRVVSGLPHEDHIDEFDEGQLDDTPRHYSAPVLLPTDYPPTPSTRPSSQAPLPVPIPGGSRIRLDIPQPPPLSYTPPIPIHNQVLPHPEPPIPP